LPIAGILNEHLTEALCQQVFESVRTNERQREWSLFTPAKFWAAVTISPPKSLDWKFFHALYYAFTQMRCPIPGGSGDRCMRCASR